MEALDRIKAAIAGKPFQSIVKINEDEHGDPIMGLGQPTVVKVLAGDVVAVAELIAKNTRTDIVRDLRKGCMPLPAGLEVGSQVKCLTHLLDEAAKATAAAPEQAPAPATIPPAPTPEAAAEE